MSLHALFAGLVFDENDQPVDVTYIGSEPCYVVDDSGFLRHIPSEQVDKQVLKVMTDLIEGHEEIISDQTAKMLGQDDPFSRAAIASQLKNIDQQFEAILNTGLPEEVRAYMGMLGFRIRINVHGEVIDVDQPGIVSEDE